MCTLYGFHRQVDENRIPDTVYIHLQHPPQLIFALSLIQPLVTDSLEVNIETFDAHAQEGFLFSIYLPGVVIGNALHACLERFFRPGGGYKKGLYWNTYFQRNAVQMFLKLYREHGHFLPVPKNEQFSSKFPRLHRLMVTDMLVSDPDDEDGKGNRPPTNHCNLAAILAFCMGRQYQLYNKARLAAKAMADGMKKAKKSEVEVYKTIKDAYGEDLKRRFLLLPSKSIYSETLNVKWQETKKRGSKETMASPTLLQKMADKVMDGTLPDEELVVKLAVDDPFLALQGFTPSVWAVPDNEFGDYWDAADEMQRLVPRTKEEVRQKQATNGVPMSKCYHITLENIVRGIFINQDPDFDHVAACLEEHLHHFTVHDHFSFYWHRSSLVPRKAAECKCPSGDVSNYFIKDSKSFVCNEALMVPQDCSGFVPEFLFAFPRKETAKEKQKEDKKKNKKKKKKQKKKKLDGSTLQAKLQKVTELGEADSDVLMHVYEDMIENKLEGYLEEETASDRTEHMNLRDESMAVAASTLMHCYLEKAKKCAELLSAIPETRGYDTQGLNLNLAARKVFEKDIFDEPEVLGSMAKQTVPNTGGWYSEVALETVPAFLAYKLGHIAQAEEAEKNLQGENSGPYYLRLIKDDKDMEAEEGNDNESKDDEGKSDDIVEDNEEDNEENNEDEDGEEDSDDDGEEDDDEKES